MLLFRLVEFEWLIILNIMFIDEMVEKVQEQEQVGENGNPITETSDKRNLSEQVIIICFSLFS